MKLSELAFSCWLYGRFTGFDKDYLDLLQKTDNSLCISNTKHVEALLKWLNKWGCRQFAVNYHNLAISEIRSWYGRFRKHDFGERDSLDLTDDDLSFISDTFNGLMDKTASFRRRKSNRSRVRIGPTGAAKILFALNPEIFPPWDQAIREDKEYNYDGSGDSYVEYLRKIRSILLELKPKCEKIGFKLEELPRILERENSTLPKLIDEYSWVKITNKCIPPTSDIFKKWSRWSELED